MSEVSFQKSESKFINKTLLYMALGLIITFAVSYLISTNLDAVYFIYFNSGVVIGLTIIELALVVILTRALSKMSTKTAIAMFITYSVINGLTLGSIFIYYDLSSIISVFIVAAAMFFCCSMIGMTAKINLSTIGRVAIMAVFGIIIINVLNLFMRLDGLSIMASYIGVVAFCALTAYDMQNIKRIHNESYMYDSETVNKFAIIGALELYLDFINLFIHLLRIFGRRD